MEKRLLRKIPIPASDTEKISAAAKAGKDIRGVIVTQLHKADDVETLVLNVYQTSGKNKRDVSLLFRVFCQKNEFITLDMEKGNWRTGALMYLICRDSGWAEYWWSYSQLLFLTEKDTGLMERTLRRWLKEYGVKLKDKSGFYVLDAYQGTIKGKRREKKYRKIFDVIDADMEKFGDLPDDYQNFVEEKVFNTENYIFYNTKEKRAYCTSCKTEFTLENKKLVSKRCGIWNDRDIVRHNSTVRCPYCNKYLVAKSEGMSKLQLISLGWSVLVQPHGEEVLTRYFRHTKDFRIDFHNPKIVTSEEYRTVHSAEKVADYMYAEFRQTGNVRWCFYRDRGSSWYPPSEWVAPRSAMLYNTSLQEAVDGTWLRYSVPDDFVEHVANDPRKFKTPWLVDNYFNTYRKQPYIEQLIKVGFYEITREIFTNDRYDKIELNEGCNSVLGTLGINKYQYNMLRRIGDPRGRDLEILRYKPDLKWDEFAELRYIHDDGWDKNYRNYIDCMEFTTLYKLKKYIVQQKITHDKDYFDYIDWLKEMNYNMKNEFNIYPKDFRKAHDEMSKQYVRFKDQKAREDTKRFNQLLKKLKKETADVDAMNLDIEGLFIRLPNRLEELKQEGEALHHCVGTYMQRVKNGKTMIFFIRRKDEPDKSYYTLEWKGKVIQCRGLHNCDMTPEVKAFVEIFQQKMTEYENKPTKRRKAG